MAKYKIWDKKENIITPVGEILTPTDWISRYPVANVLDTICSGGVVNGSLFAVYEQFIEMYKKRGVDFTGCETKQDYLDAIETWEDEQSKQTAQVDANTRIADALEDMVVLTELNSLEVM